MLIWEVTVWTQFRVTDHRATGDWNEERCLLLFYTVVRSLKFNKLTMPAASQAQPNPELLHRT